MTKQIKFCECNQYCLDSKCVSSDSGLKVRKCWCADCKVERKEAKANAYKISVTNGVNPFTGEVIHNGGINPFTGEKVGA